MKIYCILRDESYPAIDWRCAGVSEFSADPLEDVGPQEISPFVGDGRLGNFLNTCDGALLFDEVASAACQDFIEAAGQIFPICMKGAGTYYLLNVLETCNPVDKKNSVLEPANWRTIVSEKRLAFKENRVFSNSSLFKIPELGYKPILTFSETGFHEWEFYSIYKENGLTGLLFEEIWVSE